MAISNLKREDNGEFYFRPSSKGTNHLTLTWKFYESNIVHIDIQEFDKAIGANIGSKLKISDEYYENLQEVVERYITPCNRSIREVTQHPKFFSCKKIEEVQGELEKEKSEASSKIPYKFVMLDDYPQYVILCYIPNKSIVREFIKVKPRGYNFHGQYHYPFVSLINWFK
jgi:transcription elongation factor SPT6